MNDLTVEQVITFHNKVMESDGGDDRLLSEAGLHQMVFSANRIENIFTRTAFTFFSLVAYPVYRDGNNCTAQLMAEMILTDNGYTLEADKDEMTALVQGITSFTLEQADIEEWLHLHSKKASDPRSLL
ncbi:MAG: type II toxin-antitoxin system death-on-curing family toxin [Methanoregula sp.]|nr:type II toxin-antitoxin system death-on-curing family toxin [Methanoregula sp.]